MYDQISIGEYQKFKTKQDFELRDFEELSLFLIDLQNDDIDYSRIKDNGLLIKFWGKKKPDFFNLREDMFVPVHPRMDVNRGIDFEDTNLLLGDIIEQIENGPQGLAGLFQVATQTTSTTTTQPITTSTTTTTTTGYQWVIPTLRETMQQSQGLQGENNFPVVPTNRGTAKTKKEKYYNPVQIHLNISKIPDEYFLADVFEAHQLNLGKHAYFKIDQIDGLIEFIKFAFNSAEITPFKKMNEEIKEMLDSIING